MFTSGFLQVGSLTSHSGEPHCACPPPSPAGVGSALPVKAELEFSCFCIPHKALASVAQFFSNPLSFKNRH